MEESSRNDERALVRWLRHHPESAAREEAAVKLGKVTGSSRQIVVALMDARKDDISGAVRVAAAESLDAPVHPAFWQEDPELKDGVEALISKEHDLVDKEEASIIIDIAISLVCLVIGIIWSVGEIRAITVLVLAGTGIHVSWCLIVLGVIGLIRGIVRRHKLHRSTYRVKGSDQLRHFKWG
jgi:hypothetical protein